MCQRARRPRRGGAPATASGRATATTRGQSECCKRVGSSPLHADWLRTLVPLTWQTTRFCGGLRGSIPIALVLGLADLAGIDAVAVIFAVVFISLVAEGLTFRPVLHTMNLVPT